MPKPPSAAWVRHAIARRGVHLVPNAPVQITTLPNKIRVATESTPGHFASVGLYIDAGSRYETPATSGVSHFIDRMAFKATTTRTGEEMTEAIHALGCQIFCSSSRESIMYQSSSFPKSIPNALSLIAESALRPLFQEEEVEQQQQAARYEVREITNKPELILPEILHEVAYGGRGLGNPLLCPEERIDTINGPTMHKFLNQWFRPERMVIAGAGMHHEQLVEWADKFFSFIKSSAPQPDLALANRQPLGRSTAQNVPSHLLPQSPPTSSFSLYKTLSRAASSYLYPPQVDALDSPSVHSPQYEGGHKFIFKADSEFNHLYLAYEGVGIHDNDVYTLATMQILLGGGGSFSAGGPGKGMYSRLYTHVLNHHPQVDHCASFHHIYTDSSLFGLFASFLPSSPTTSQTPHYYGSTPSQVLPHLAHQLSLLLYQDVPTVELDRAKNQLKSSLMMALESRTVEVEDLGRQVLIHNRKIPVTEMCEHIDQVSAADIRRVAARIFGPGSPNSKATIVTMGSEDVVDWKTTLRKYGIAE